MQNDIVELPQPKWLSKNDGVYGIKINNSLLAGMPFPRTNSIWTELHKCGIEHVVCLTDDIPTYKPSPLKILASYYLKDLFGGQVPDDTEKEKIKIQHIVKKVSGRIKSGEAVVIHCEGGTGRTGTVIGCTLRELGYTEEQVLKTMNAINMLRGRDGHGWPESEYQKELVEEWMHIN